MIIAKYLSALEKQWDAFKIKATETSPEINDSKTKLPLGKRRREDLKVGDEFNMKPKYYNGDYIWTYLDIPVSTNEKIIAKHLETKLSEFKQEVDRLWNFKLPLRSKYHLHQSCQVGKLAYYSKGIFCEGDITPQELSCIEETDELVESSLPSVLYDTPTTLRRLPYQFGRMNMSTLGNLAAITYIDVKQSNSQTLTGYEFMNIPERCIEIKSYIEIRRLSRYESGM